MTSPDSTLSASSADSNGDANNIILNDHNNHANNGSADAMSTDSVSCPSPAMGGPFPTATLACRPNSHPFQDRTLILDQAVKVGRSVARARPAQNNAIFDCKVLSRNHALLWYEKGKFYLQDTKSSNGTFVNNQRLSKGSEESLPREVCSGDILQFGVDVMENSRKVTHGCIITTLRLYLPDGKEAKASPTITSSGLGGGMGSGHLPPQDLYMLNQYIQEALAREQILETKLALLQRLVGQTEVASGDAWKSLIDEDRLLTRVEILESQLSAYGKSMTEDKLREETKRLIEEKEEYQELAKNTMQNLANDKLDAVKKAKELERQLGSVEEEYSVLKEMYDKDVEESRNLNVEIERLTNEMEELKKKIPEESDEKDQDKEQDKEKPEDENNVEISVNEESKEGDDEVQDQTNVCQTEAEANPNTPESIEKLSCELNAKSEELLLALQRCAQLQTENDRLTQELNEKIKQVPLAQDNDENIQEVNCGGQDPLPEPEATQDPDQQTKSDNEIDVLRQRLSELESENTNLAKEILDLKEQTSSTSMLNSSFNTSNVEQEEKLAQLLKVKEKFVEVSQTKDDLETSMRQLEGQVEALSLQSQAATLCSLVPLAILAIAIIMAFLPTLSSVFGTSE